VEHRPDNVRTAGVQSTREQGDHTQEPHNAYSSGDPRGHHAPRDHHTPRDHHVPRYHHAPRDHHVPRYHHAPRSCSVIDIEQCDTLPVGKTAPTAAEEQQTLQLQSVQGSTLQLVVGVETNPGIARKNAPNEDSVLALQGTRPFAGALHPVGLFVVADGMGGHAHGQEASQLAVQAIHDTIVPTLQRVAEENEDELFAELLKEGVHRANLAIYQRNRHSEEKQAKMGTTITAALVVNTQAYIVNVGDSRTYRYRQGEGLTQLTQDHSVVARLVENGVITRDDIYTHPQRNQIYRCLGDHPSVQADFFKVELQVHDLLLLCSDGLWEMVRDPDIEKIISSSCPHAVQTSTILIQAALNRGGADNVSVVVVGIEP